MSKIALEGNASGTGTLTIAAPNTSTDRTLTLPDESGTVLTSASSITQNAGPAFRVEKTGSNQSVTNNTSTKVTFSTVTFDATSSFDSGNNRYTPNVAGYYWVQAGADIGANAGTLSRPQIMIWKNGSVYKASSPFLIGFAGNEAGPIVTDLVYLNGSTDYVEIYVYITGTSPIVYASPVWTNFSAALVRAA